MLAVTATVPLAFIAGLVSCLSPCVFPLMPAYAAYLGGTAGGGSEEDDGSVRRAPMVANGLAFVAGFTVVFVAFFYVLTALEIRFVAGHRHAVDVIAGVIVIALALQTMGLFRWGWLMRERRIHLLPRGGLLGAFLLGLTFAAGWSPCLGPVLGAILQVAADGGFAGLPLMLVYCAGLAVPFLLIAVLANRMQGFLRRINQRMGVINIVAGCLLLVFGVLLATDRITSLSSIVPGSPFDI